MAYYPVIRDIGLTARDTLAFEVDYYASEAAFRAGAEPLCTDEAIIQCPATETRAVFDDERNVIGHETVPYDVEGEVERILARFAERKERRGQVGDLRSARVRSRATWLADHEKRPPAERQRRDPDNMLGRPRLRAMMRGRR